MAAARSAGDPPTAAPYVPVGADLSVLGEAARGCHGCDLYREATQTVFGQGDSTARLVLVGEQPGDVEDRRGEPFVGPAGVVLRRGLDDVGIDPDHVYVTNAVKHFKFSRRGQRRIHRTPDRIEIRACRPWLAAEFAQLRPRGVIALGATAAQALLGPSFRVTRSRGALMPWPDSADAPEDFPPAGGQAFVMATLHPSAVLRADDRDRAYEGFVADLQVAARALLDG